MTTYPISRRTLLKGLGVSVALPLLDAMMPQLAWGQQAAQPMFPKRLAFCYVPNGVNNRTWFPAATGRTFDLPATLEPLQPFKEKLLVLSGLTCDKARPNGDGPGDHARAMGAFLTCSQPRKTDGANIRTGVSVDQYCAQNLGNPTRFPSLEIGIEPGRQAGGCDSGYSCAYSSNLSWRSETTPQPKETNPRAVFDRLFAGVIRQETDAENRARRERDDQSVLDFVMEDANLLNNRLGVSDQRRMDEYLTSLRDVERRITTTFVPGADGQAAMQRPSSNPGNYRDHLRIMGDLLALAFQTDLTRISTFVFANEGSNRNYRIIDVADGHHDISHQGSAEKLAKIARINRFHVEQFAYLLDKLDHIREGEGTLLDNCMIVYGSGNGDGNRHNHDDLPILLAGKGGGTLATGQHLRYARNTPIANLYLELLDRMGTRAESFGDSNGRLGNLS